MPITITCEHCSEKAEYAVNSEGSEITLKPKVIISPGQRHICGSAVCLVKELESQSRSFSAGRFYFADARRIPGVKL
jgi:hypothetical protein